MNDKSSSPPTFLSVRLPRIRQRPSSSKRSCSFLFAPSVLRSRDAFERRYTENREHPESKELPISHRSAETSIEILIQSPVCLPKPGSLVSQGHGKNRDLIRRYSLFEIGAKKEKEE